MGAELTVAAYTFTAPASALPSPSAVTDLAVNYALPELVRWLLFAAGFGLVVYVIRRMTGVGA